jgi:pimeloyl-ACP methyl ester carboxylesterase
MGLNDVPAIIDFVLNKTNKEKLTYIGHSQGTTQMFMAASVEPEYYKSKINLFVALAPVVKMKNTLSYSLRFLSKHRNMVEWLGVDVLHKYSIFGPKQGVDFDEVLLCRMIPALCDLGIWAISDREVDLINMDREDVIFSLFPSGCGYKNFIHYG